MDDERDRLVSALRTRLTDLDAKVAAYCRDQADDFRRYAAGRLGAVAADVAADVAQVINREASDRSHGRVPFAALYPGFLRDGGPDTVDVVVLAGPSVLPDPSPPHNRNDDFRGVFTPPFLPLLDGSTHSRPARLPSDTAAAAATAAVAVPSPVLSPPPAALPSPAKEPEPLPRLKGALRRPWTSLATRRPSETRHVRFSLNGCEMLPTSSPPRRESGQDSSSLRPSHHTSSISGTFEEIDLSRYDTVNSSSSSNSNSSSSSSSMSSNNDNSNDSNSEPGSRPEELGVATAHVDTYTVSDSLAGDEQGPLFLSAGNDSQQQHPQQQQRWDPSLGRGGSGSLEPHFQPTDEGSQQQRQRQQHRRRHSLILDDDELEPVSLSRRISSSDRLRALSRVPLEDPSMWTVVDPQSDPADVELDASAFVAEPAGTEDHLYTALSPRESSTHESEELRGDTYDHNHTSDDEGSADPFISMRSARGNMRSREAAGIVALPSRSPSEPIAEPVLNGAATTAAATTTAATTTVATAATATTTTATTATTAATTPTLHPEPAEEDDFFDFEHDEADGSGDDVVGYPLARVSSARPYLSDNDSEADDAEAVPAEASVPDEKVDEKDGETVDEKDDEKAETPVERTAEELPAPREDAADASSADNKAATLLRGLPAMLANHRQMMPRDVSQSLNRAILGRTGHGHSLDLGQTVSLSLGSAHGAASSGFRATSPTSPTTPTSPTFAASVGSYRGRPISMFNVVRDPRILQEVAQLGEFSSFVGGVDGRTGVDGMDDIVGSFAVARDLHSSSNSMGLSGTPRSLSERMAMEEAFRGRR